MQVDHIVHLVHGHAHGSDGMLCSVLQMHHGARHRATRDGDHHLLKRHLLLGAVLFVVLLDA